MPTYREMWPVYAKQWDRVKITDSAQARAAAQKAMANKARYVEVVDRFNKIHGTDLPWYWIPPVHYREADFDFGTQLAQGDRLDQVSTHVPRGQGPYTGPDAWERAAIIALETDDLDKVRDFNILEKLIFYWEKYNGFGYHAHGVPSAYVWAGTNIYEGGMFVGDGQWSPGAHDERVGCVAILKVMMELDDTIKPARETEGDDHKPPPPPPEPTDLAGAIAALNAAAAAMREVTARLERLATAQPGSTAVAVRPRAEVLPPAPITPPAPNLAHALPVAVDLLSAVIAATPQGAALKGALSALNVIAELSKGGPR